MPREYTVNSADDHEKPSEETDLAAAVAAINFKPRSIRTPSAETEKRICSHGIEADECLECHNAEVH